MQIWAESGKSALPICNYSQILYQFLTFTQNLKRSQIKRTFLLLGFSYLLLSFYQYNFISLCTSASPNENFSFTFDAVSSKLNPNSWQVDTKT